MAFLKEAKNKDIEVRLLSEFPEISQKVVAHKDWSRSAIKEIQADLKLDSFGQFEDSGIFF